MDLHDRITFFLVILMGTLLILAGLYINVFSACRYWSTSDILRIDDWEAKLCRYVSPPMPWQIDFHGTEEWCNQHAEMRKHYNHTEHDWDYYWDYFTRSFDEL